MAVLNPYEIAALLERWQDATLDLINALRPETAPKIENFNDLFGAFGLDHRASDLRAQAIKHIGEAIVAAASEPAPAAATGPLRGDWPTTERVPGAPAALDNGPAQEGPA